MATGSTPGLTNLEYAPLAEMMGRMECRLPRCSTARRPTPATWNCCCRYGSPAQQERWLTPLMHGETRSAYLMTEPQVASSDATNVEARIVRDGDHYVVNGRKWWSTGVGDPDCDLLIVMGKTDPDAAPHQQQSQIIVPRDTPGVEIVRMLTVFGYDDAPHGHGEVVLKDVRVPAENLILGEGRGFEIAQGRLGPGRIHHCMRTIGVAEAALEAMCRRLLTRRAFGKMLSEQSIWEERVARARVDIEMCRLLTLRCAALLDQHEGRKVAHRRVDDQAGRAACRAEGDRRCDPGAWRRRRRPGFRAGRPVRQDADDAAGRWAGQGPFPRHRAQGIQASCGGLSRRFFGLRPGGTAREIPAGARQAPP
ncbi:MAG: acyl-CoA dehydrogenase family protein [Gemmatales bacterium]